MKTIKFLRFLLMFTVIISMVMVSCKKDDDDDDNNTPTSAAYSNTNDTTTTGVKVAIPKIDITQSGADQMQLFLSVTNQDGVAMQSFNEYNFQVFIKVEGSVDSSLLSFIAFSTYNQSGGNIAAAMMLDYSGSMSGTDITNMENATISFVNMKSALDQAEIIKFAADVQVMVPFTTNKTDLIDAVNTQASVGGLTSFYDAIIQGLTDAHTVTGNYLPAILAFTDGGDNDSQYTYDDCVNMANQYQIPIYTIGFGSVNESAMKGLANETGGFYLYNPDSQGLANLYTLLNGQLQNLYLANFAYTWVGTITIIVKVSYTCGNGTFFAFAYKTFTYP